MSNVINDKTYVPSMVAVPGACFRNINVQRVHAIHNFDVDSSLNEDKLTEENTRLQIADLALNVLFVTHLWLFDCLW